MYWWAKSLTASRKSNCMNMDKQDKQDSEGQSNLKFGSIAEQSINFGNPRIENNDLRGARKSFAALDTKFLSQEVAVGFSELW